jgi:N-acyl-D-amino-acid deacylase
LRVEQSKFRVPSSEFRVPSSEFALRIWQVSAKARSTACFASGSGVRRYQEGVPHPRGYGNNALVLARYTRELKLLRLEEAIRRMTSLPATTFRLRGRGELKEGKWADLVVFDAEKVQDHATFKDPHHYSTGFAYVFVNGVAVVKGDVHTGARPGRVLRHESGP